MNELPAGLRSADIPALQAKYGRNVMEKRKKRYALVRFFRVLTEPMFLLLIGAAAVYFALGEPTDGAVLSVFVVVMIVIDFLQEWRTDRTLSALGTLSAPRARVLRDGVAITTDSAELVPGDLIELTEGDRIPADGRIVAADALRVDESLLTGEADGVWKNAADEAAARVYAGTSVLHGAASVLVTATGARTEYGRIGGLLAKTKTQQTPLQKQTRRLVGICAAIAGALFVLVALVTYFDLAELSPAQRLTQSVLSGVALAMAMIPEEFPVVLTVFLSMCAWRLAKKKALVKSLHAAETLGAVTVLCVDKTGTLTQNRMSVSERFADDPRELTYLAGLACERLTRDATEQAILAHCAETGFPEPSGDGRLIRIYPFTPDTMAMGQIWQTERGPILAAKGAPEKLIPLCVSDPAARAEAMRRAEDMAGRGLRVLAVAAARPDPNAPPSTLADAGLRIVGLIGLSDPPKDGIAAQIKLCRRARVRLVMITGDGASTARAIARQVGIPSSRVVTGAELDAGTEADAKRRIAKADIFCRVVPEQKLRIVKILQELGETVAMTGDGVNDAPALRQADIGIAMGNRGSEVCREAADLVLLDDNFATIPQTIRDARRVYANIRRAVGYIFAVHIPIALISLLAPLCGVSASSLPLQPVHMVLLELLIDPTCSVVLERIPEEADAFRRPPRNGREPLLTRALLLGSVAQGLALFAASFSAYLFLLSYGGAAQARAVLLAVLCWGNFWLVAVNASADGILPAMKSMYQDKLLRVVCPLALILPIPLLYTPIATLLRISPLSAPAFFAAFLLAALSVLWYEIVKAVLRRKRKQNIY